MAGPTPSPPTDLGDALGGLRAAIAAEGPRAGLAAPEATDPAPTLLPAAAGEGSRPGPCGETVGQSGAPGRVPLLTRGMLALAGMMGFGGTGDRGENQAACRGFGGGVGPAGEGAEERGVAARADGARGGFDVAKGGIAARRYAARADDTGPSDCGSDSAGYGVAGWEGCFTAENAEERRGAARASEARACRAVFVATAKMEPAVPGSRAGGRGVLRARGEGVRCRIVSKIRVSDAAGSCVPFVAIA